ncbi:MAG: MBL fold metallo-hydrolase [Betaproteobacteria bacterium HGW-Betaproteobacteria-8]|nr:MAG: MBL fold metallo-hydrolase [Betaproteobacteria bacterium HGW-Betaproteobacteria-8]
MLQVVIALFGLLIITSQPHAQPLKLEKVADGVYVHHGVHEDLSEGYHGDICNIGFIVGSKGIAVIDSGGTFKVGQRFRKAIREVSDLPVLYVINTHVHPDHIYGNAAFSPDQPQFVGHAKLADAMERRKDAYNRIHQEWLGDEFAGSEMIKPTLPVKDNLTLDLGNRQLHLSAHPVAHTNTDLTVIDSKTSTLWSGDLLFVERTPSIDGDIKGWISVTESLGQLSVKQTVPGHGPVVNDLTSALNNQHRYLTTLLNDIRASIKKGEVMESAMNTAAASEKDRWVLFDIVNRRNVNNIYPGLEWE